MYDLITIGSISVDLYFKGASLTSSEGRFQLAMGGKYFAEHFYESIGGGATNVAIGAMNNGIKTAIFGKIGDNSFKKLIFHELEEKNMHHDYCQLEKNYQNVSTILLADNGEKTVINYRTDHEKIFNNSEDKRHLLNAKWIYFSNVYYISMTERIDVMQELKKNNIQIVVNLGIKDCRREISQVEKLIERADIIIVNAHEFSEMVKKDYSGLNFKDNLLPHFPFLQGKLLVITDGKKGSYAYFGSQHYYQPAEEIDKVIDTTGAGDGYTAGFLAEYIKTHDLQKAMVKGAHYAVKILKKIGAN